MCVSKNTAAEAYEEERMNASGRRTRLAVRRLRLESTRAAKISQGRGFHQEKGTTNRLFRNTQKKKKNGNADYPVRSRWFDVSAGSKTGKEIWQVDK